LLQYAGLTKSDIFAGPGEMPEWLNGRSRTRIFWKPFPDKRFGASFYTGVSIEKKNESKKEV
jgi:hypothetical protein